MQLIIYTESDLRKLVRLRSQETKLGERVQFAAAGLPLEDALHNSASRYVLLGLPEDIGVRANYGRGGAYSAWQPALTTLLNVQSNETFSGSELMVLGHVDFSNEMNAMKDFDFHAVKDVERSREMVSALDDYITPVIKAIVTAGKIPIVIGGGHNNAFPCIRGTAEALASLKKISSPSIHVLNCDAHSDLRPLEGRHSGNGFSYAFDRGFLGRYAVLGLQEIFSPEFVFKKLEQHREKIKAITFEDIYIREKLTFSEAVNQCLEFVKGNFTGLELDLDIIQNIPSSAKTSSGISTIEARRFVHRAASTAEIAYFHIAEAAPVLSHLKTDLKTGKLIAYLVSDFIKARNAIHPTYS